MGALARLSIAFSISALITPAPAQELKVRQMRMESDGQLVWSAGSTVSKAGVAIPFDSHTVDKKFVGFKLESAATESLKSGDQVLLHFPDLKVVGDHTGRRDVTGAKVIGGAWRAVTIQSVTRSGARAVISFNDELTLNNGQKIKKLELPVVDGFLLPVMTMPAKK